MNGDLYQNFAPTFRTLINNAVTQYRPKMVILVSPSKTGTADMFSDFKTVTEVEFGLHSLCLASSSAWAQKYGWNRNYLQVLEGRGQKAYEDISRHRRRNLNQVAISDLPQTLQKPLGWKNEETDTVH